MADNDDDKDKPYWETDWYKAVMTPEYVEWLIKHHNVPQYIVDDANELAIATPGPTKQWMISRDLPGSGILRSIWDRAEEKIHSADAIVFLGYRIPPTDASTRKWFIDNIRENHKVKKDEDHNRLHVYTVVGEAIESADSRRLQGLLQGIHRGVRVHRQPMRAEDFLALYRPQKLPLFREDYVR